MTLYMCDYDCSSGSFVFKQKQSHLHPNRSINLWGKNQKYLDRISKYSASCLHPNMEFE